MTLRILLGPETLGGQYGPHCFYPAKKLWQPAVEHSVLDSSERNALKCSKGNPPLRWPLLWSLFGLWLQGWAKPGHCGRAGRLGRAGRENWRTTSLSLSSAHRLCRWEGELWAACNLPAFWSEFHWDRNPWERVKVRSGSPVSWDLWQQTRLTAQKNQKMKAHAVGCQYSWDLGNKVKVWPTHYVSLSSKGWAWVSQMSAVWVQG